MEICISVKGYSYLIHFVVFLGLNFIMGFFFMYHLNRQYKYIVLGLYLNVILPLSIDLSCWMLELILEQFLVL